MGDLSRLPEGAEAGTVDEVGRLEPALGERVGQRRDALGRREIGGDDLRPRVAGGGDLVRQCVERRLAARGQHQRVAVAGELAGERSADAGGGAGNEADGLDG